MYFSFNNSVVFAKLVTAGIAAFAAFSPSSVFADAPVVLDPSHVIAKGKNVQLTKADFDAEVARIPPEQREPYLVNPERVVNVINRAAYNKILAAAARRQGIDKDVEVRAYLEYVIERELAILYSERLAKNIKVPDLEARAREQYQVNPGGFTSAEMVRASHILISNKNRHADEAKKLALEVRELALQGKDTFENLAMKYSEDPSVGRNKGDLGFFPFEQMTPSFSKAAFALKEKGAISEPVESPFGFHIIQLIDRKPAVTKSYAEVRQGLLDEAARDYRGVAVKEAIEAALASEQVKVEPAIVEKLTIKVDMDALIRKAEQKKQSATVEAGTNAK
jgi:peptidyl-prolyl cis-trans isomerase C